MLQSVLRKMCVFMWILTLSLNYIRSRNVDEAKFVFFYGVCLKNTFQLERRVAEVQKCSCFLHLNSFLFPSIVTAAKLHVAQWWRLHCSILLLLLWWWCYCCASSPVVHAPDFTSADFHFFNQTNTDAAWWQRVDFPEWLCDCVEQLCSEGVQQPDHWDIPAWYKLNTNWRRRRVLSSLRNIPSVVGISHNSKLNIANAVSHCKITYLHKISF